MKNKDIIKQINSDFGSPSKGCAKRHKKSPTAGLLNGSIKGLIGYKVPEKVTAGFIHEKEKTQRGRF